VSTRIRRTGHVTRKGERRGATWLWWGSLREKKDHMKDPSVDKVKLK
jgi:hypothetical protein